MDERQRRPKEANKGLAEPEDRRTRGHLPTVWFLKTQLAQDPVSKSMFEPGFTLPSSGRFTKPYAHVDGRFGENGVEGGTRMLRSV